MSGRVISGGPSLRYEGPVVSAVVPGFGSTFGHEVVIITGRNFGTTDCDRCLKPRVSVGGYACVSAELVDEHTVKCVVPAAAAAGPVPVVVTVLDHSSQECGDGCGGAGGSTHVISLLDFHLDDVHGTEPMKGAGCSSGAPRLDPKMDTSVSPKQEPDAGLICSMKGPSSR